MNNRKYFSFGSNMDRAQMKRRTPNARYFGVGVVKDYDIVFNRTGTYHAGGVASIVESQGSNVYGVIWDMNDAELAEMDRIENPTAYHRETIPVAMNDGQVIDCQVYITYPQGDLPADQEYLERIIAAADAADLPSKWIERLKKYRTAIEH